MLKRGSAVIGFFCLSILGLYAFSQHREKIRAQDPRYLICKIAQTTEEKEALKTDYLAELLLLSRDQPTSLYAFDCKKAEEKLLASPLIYKAKVKKEFPDTVSLDYEVRKPIARLLDYENIAIDKELFLFPLVPFFSPKEIPAIYLGLPPFGASKDACGNAGGNWQEPLESPLLSLALEILDYLEEIAFREKVRIKCIDVSNAFALSLGQREVVLLTEEELFLPQGGTVIFPKLLRLSPKEYAQQLSSFFLLRRHMEADYRKQLTHLTSGARFAPRIIDLRIPHLGFVENR